RGQLYGRLAWIIHDPATGPLRPDLERPPWLPPRRGPPLRLRRAAWRARSARQPAARAPRPPDRARKPPAEPAGPYGWAPRGRTAAHFPAGRPGVRSPPAVPAARR